MTIRNKKPLTPADKMDTARHEIIGAMTGRDISAREISAIAGILEKEVYAHLEHIRRSLHAEGRTLIITFSSCRKCGFVFRKRERLTRPGKCPACKGTSIEGPFFRVEG